MALVGPELLNASRSTSHKVNTVDRHRHMHSKGLDVCPFRRCKERRWSFA